jgi:hypothetical protein
MPPTADATTNTARLSSLRFTDDTHPPAPTTLVPRVENPLHTGDTRHPSATVYDLTYLSRTGNPGQRRRQARAAKNNANKVIKTAKGLANDPFYHQANAVVDPNTGASLEYRHLKAGPDSVKWLQAATNEIGRLTQGTGPDMPTGTDTMFFIKHTDKPSNKKATYLRIVAAHKPHKAEPCRIRFTCGGDKIDYPGNVSTPTVDLTTVKCHLNSVLSTPGAKYMTLDISDFYLNTPMDTYEYMRIPVSAIPDSIMSHYSLQSLIHDNFVMVEIRKGMYGLPQAGILAQQRLIKHLSTYGYHPAPHTPGLFTHETRPISFTLCVDDFGVKYVGLEHAEHLVSCVSQLYKITTDWTGTLYTGLTLSWDYVARTLDISMPGYIAKALTRFQHPTPTRPQHSPHSWIAPHYGAASHLVDAPDTSAALPPSGILYLQQVIGTLLFYARAVDNTLLVALGSLSSAQAHGTEETLTAVTQILDYCATHPDATVRFHASDMILHIHSDASYLSVSNARSRYGGYFYLHNGTLPAATPADPTVPTSPPNGPVLVTSAILDTVVSSAAEAELGALFHNAKEGVHLRTILCDLGHPQPGPTPLQTDNACAAGIANDSIKQRRSKAMDMRFYWIRDRVGKKQLSLIHI